MQRGKEEIYDLLREKILLVVQKSLTPEELTDLDGVLWGVADMLSEPIVADSQASSSNRRGT